jgi:hypothetical protein
MGCVVPERYVKCAARTDKEERLNQVVKIASPVNQTVYFDSLATDDVEDEIGFNN